MGKQASDGSHEPFPAVFVPAPHPATIPIERLCDDIQQRFQRRSGPGGQHRNKTSSGVFLVHTPSGVDAEATERRSQADNRVIATKRLRYNLAVGLRTASPIQPSGENRLPTDNTQNLSLHSTDETEWAVRDRYRGKRLKLNEANSDKPAVLALLLNDLHSTGGQMPPIAKGWEASGSSIVTFLKTHPPAFQLLNSIRSHAGLRPLR